MFDQIQLGREFFEWLTAVDAAIAASVASAACPVCRGPLHTGNYPRKPRGGLLGVAGEVCTVRFSLCCGREGCRKRATPPSVRFLGRRVYVGAVVLVASAIAVAVMAAGAAQRATGVPPRTLRRWLRWWRGPFTETAPFVELRSRLIPAPDRRMLPSSILERLTGPMTGRVATLLARLAPITTGSTPDGARFVRGIA